MSEAAVLPSWLALAEQAGRHALTIFAVLLVVVLLGALAADRALRRAARPRAHGPGAPALRLGLYLAVGFAVIVLAALVFADLAEELHAEATLGLLDQAFTDGVGAGVPRSALPVFAALTRLGDTATLTGLCVAVAALLVVRRQRVLALGWVVAVAGNALLNDTLKQVFERVRPLHDDAMVLAHGFSFPSGHSSGAVVAYGMLAYLALRLLPRRGHLPAVLAAAALAFSVGASRVFLRVHFASDVIAGFASGAAWLAVCVTSLELTLWWRGRHP